MARLASRAARSYALHITAAQDWSADGLARVLWEHEGELAEFRYQAHGADVAGADAPSDVIPGMMGDIRLIAPTYGGEADTFAELDVTLPCTTKPELITAAFPAALMARRSWRRGRPIRGRRAA